MDFLLIIAVIAVIALIAVLFVQHSKTKSVLLSVEKDRQALEEKEKLLLKEARIKAIEELQDDREKLNEEEREVVVLHLVSGLKHREIAKMLDKPLSTILSKYNRAIAKLKTVKGSV